MPRTTQRTILLLGKESTGKSQLISALTAQTAYSANFRGSTVTCETYETKDYQFIDTPGLLYRSDSQTSQDTIAQLEENETAILVVKATHAAEDFGLLERLTIALHSLLRPFGLSGRDLVRVMMGFGCNVPAVISTRSCSGCTRQTCISAIAFGSACSYQFGATLAVFSAAKLQWLVIPYLLDLTITTLIYTRIFSPSIARSPHNELMIEHQIFLEKPRFI